MSALNTKMIKLLLTVVLSAAVLFWFPPQADADTENCASLGEYDRLVRGLYPWEVANLFDITGNYTGDTPDGEEFRRSYRSCWAPGERKVVVWYSYNSGGSTRWDIRDV